MPAHHDLIVTADSARNLAELQLLDEAGVQVASRSVDFDSIRISRKQALFDLRSYLRLYVEAGQEEEEVARVGVFLAEEILGEEIFLTLWTPQNQRHLRVQLPGQPRRRTRSAPRSPASPGRSHGLPATGRRWLNGTS